MVSVGALLLAFLAYQLYGTGLLTARSQQQAQAQLSERFAEVSQNVVVTSTVPASTSTVPAGGGTTTTAADVEPAVLRYEEPAPEEGSAFGTIQIPKIGLDKVLFEGVDRATLKKGPGHMPWTPLPGQPGNAVISGHRTTYGAPFFDLNELTPGDEIIIETALGRHVYRVRKVFIVAPTDVWVTDDRSGGWLTLTTCNPRYSARERLIVQAELVEGPNFLYTQATKEPPPGGAS